MFVKADVSVEASIVRVTNAAIERFGRIDCAFNNAGRSDGSRLPWHERDA